MKRRKWMLTLGILCVVALAFAGLVFRGVIHLNTPSRDVYPVRGVDVSHYQGDIDWGVLAEQDVQFAFIKATEGSSYQDDRFAENLAGALQTSIRPGAYHFFSFDSPGRTQAKNFIQTVPKTDGMLPGCVDFEFYADKWKNPPPIDAVRTELRAMLEALEKHYGVRPIIYTAKNEYTRYIAGAFDDYDLWIRNVYLYPSLQDGRDWTFWQYSDTGKLDGYKGEEEFIDLNVFHGTEDEFLAYGVESESQWLFGQ